ncbi:MAG: hypothetical protein F4X55_00480 [Candidatus Dadabacteria bacterium]|nr:hypothetical protein [Candidatus Dadabacteria bacterium]MYC39486.1 hypothetical protein [Candidatus Dadabacteria bacterium]
MRKRLIYGFFLLAVAVVLGLLYYGMRNDAGQPGSHTAPPDLGSVPSSPDNVSEAVQSEEAQVLEDEPLKTPPGDRQAEQELQPQSDTTAEDPQDPTPLKGKTVTLEDGKEIIIIENVPDSWKTETEVRFDEEGKPHITHRK